MGISDNVTRLADLAVSATKQSERRKAVQALIEHYERKIAELKKPQQYNCCCGPDDLYCLCYTR